MFHCPTILARIFLSKFIVDSYLCSNGYENVQVRGLESATQAFVGLLTKAATGSCSVKKMFWDVLLLGNLRYSKESNRSLEKDLFSWKQKHAVKISCSRKVCRFTWNVKVFWILIERTKSEHPRKIRYSDKDLPIFLEYWSVPLLYLPTSLK